MGVISNIRVEPCNVSWGGVDLGYIDGSVEIAFSEDAVDITAQQRGTSILDAIRTGKNIEAITVPLKETHLAQITRIFGPAGATSTATAEVGTIVIASVASINSKYFDISTASDAILYRVWFDVNNTGVAPATAGRTLVEVDLDATPTVAEAVTALQVALDALAGFVAVESGGTTVTYTLAATGPATDAADGTSGFTFAITTQGIGAVLGWGHSKDFLGVVASAGKLVFHPVQSASTDLTRDLAFWKAYPMPQSLNYSGEDPQVISAMFKIFPDESRQEAIRLFVLGDHR